jgi:hypothetical protein
LLYYNRIKKKATILEKIFLWLRPGCAIITSCPESAEFSSNLLLTLSGLKTRRFYREFQSISLSYPSFRQGSLNIWVLALISFALAGEIISDKRNFPRVPR